MVEHLISPWIERFAALLKAASSSLVICSPFIGRRPCTRIATTVRDGGHAEISVFVLTDLSRDTMLSGATDVRGLIELSEALPQTEIRFLPKVHAKACIADERLAVVTSGNLTDSGLTTNLEYGLCLSEPNAVRKVRSDILQYGSLGSRVDVSQLRVFETIIADLRETSVRAERSLRARLRDEFDRKLRAADEEILRVRAEALSAHAAFADTILYVLSKGPKTTPAIYSEIEKIHPDLCDDSIKLVIRGEPWSQVKWHHRVRHAQLFLKRQGRIRRDGDKWRLVA
jgi:phosphatidylserine/phosphatidylglycerophosphate/cardiolipin synthase-like enzyme